MYHIDIDVRLGVEEATFMDRLSSGMLVVYKYEGSLTHIHIYEVDSRDGDSFLLLPLQEQPLPDKVIKSWDNYGRMAAHRANRRRGL